MSKLLLNQLKVIKPLFKAKGLEIEQYGVVKDGYLYFNNGVVAIKTPLDLAFNCVIHLHKFYTILQTIKTESVIVYQNSQLTINADDVIYYIDSMELEYSPIDTIINYEPQIECNNPYVFNTMMNIAENYIEPVDIENSIKHGFETLCVVDNIAYCANSANIIQGMLDFNMPNCAFNLNTINYYNKIAKSEIVGMGLQNNYLIIKFANNMVVYLKNMIKADDNIKVKINKIERTINRHWVQPNIRLPDYVKEQLLILTKLNNKNVIFFNNSFCQADEYKIDYPIFTDNIFKVRLLVKNIKSILSLSSNIEASYTNFVSFISDDNLIRGVMGQVQEND